MPKRIFSFLVVLILLCTNEIFSQDNGVENFLKNAIAKHMSDSFPTLSPNKIKFSIHPYLPAHPIESNRLFKSPKSISSSSSPFFHHPFDKNELSFFCRQEWQFEKLTSIPLRLRLGSLDYTNYLEQKPNALKPGKF